MINGVAHGPVRGDGDVPAAHAASSTTARRSRIEPWRARAFPVIKDLVVDREALDRIIAAGGFISVPTGGAPDANAIPIPKQDRRRRDGRRRVHRVRRVRRGVP